jgi:hypothetical protein
MKHSQTIKSRVCAGFFMIGLSLAILDGLANEKHFLDAVGGKSATLCETLTPLALFL